jgi:hypothetical protein
MEFEMRRKKDEDEAEDADDEAALKKEEIRSDHTSNETQKTVNKSKIINGDKKRIIFRLPELSFRHAFQKVE